MAKIKFTYEIHTVTSFTGIQRTVYSAKVGNAKYTVSSLDELRKLVENHSDLNNDGAKHDYGIGKYNGD